MGQRRDKAHRDLEEGTTLVLDTRAVEAMDRFDFWAETFAAAPEPVAIERAFRGDFQGLAKLYAGQAMSIVDIRSSALDIRRRQTDIHRGASDQVVVALVNRGTAVSEANGKVLLFGPGDVVVSYEDVPFRIRHNDAADVTIVKVPAASFSENIRRDVPLLVSPRLSPYAPLVAAYVRALPRHASALRSDAEFMMGQLVALIGRALQDDMDLGDGKRTLFRAITASIEADLANPDLSVKLLCDRLGVSRSTLYEAVAAEGMTVAGMVLDRRLAQCLTSLRHDGRRGTIAAISERCGFRDQSSFNRAFRRRFGMTPSQWRA